MKETKLSLLDCGDSFRYGGYNWTIIKEDSSKRYCLCDTLVSAPCIAKGTDHTDDYVTLNTDIPWETQDDTQTYNPFRVLLNADFLDYLITNGALYKDFYPMERDLTADDGTTLDYEHEIEDTITLLTADEYRKNRKYIRNANNQNCPYFTITPKSYNSYNSNNWKVIFIDGTIGDIRSIVSNIIASDMIEPLIRKHFRPMICLSRNATVFVEECSDT